MNKPLISSKHEIEEYYNNPALNQSRLKTLLSGVEIFKRTDSSKELYYEEKESFLLGSAVDCLITSSKETFNDIYYISSDENKPSSTIMSIINMVFDSTPQGLRKTLELNNLQDKILEALDKHEYYPKWNQQTRINKILEHYKYYEDLQKSEGKQVLSQEQYSTVTTIVDSLLTNTSIKELITPSSDCILWYQKPLYFSHYGIKCKALPDIMSYNKKTKEVIIIDLKTMSGLTIDFPNSLRKYRYDIQAAWYIQALSANAHDNSLFNDDIDSNKINFKFIVESTTNPGNPIVYNCTQELLKIGKEGRKPLKANEILVKPEIKGFNDLVSDFIYYEKQGWVRDKRLDINNGVLEIKWDGIVDKQ